MVNFKDTPLFPVAFRGENAIKLEQYFIENIDFYLDSIKQLSELNNISNSTGDNLRRIGKNIGFISTEKNDTIYKDSLYIFIFSKQSNGSIDFAYSVSKILEPVNYKYTDIWQRIEFASNPVGLLYDNEVGMIFDNGVGTLFVPDDSLDILFLEGRVDFHLNEQVQSWKKEYEEYVDQVRFVGRRVICYEVVEVDYNE